MEPVVFTLIVIVIGIVFGAACGIWAAFRVRGINSQIEHLKEELSWLRRDLRRESPTRETPTPSAQQPMPLVREEVPPKPSPVFVEAPPAWRQMAPSPVQPEVPKPDYGKPGEAPQWLTSLPSFEQMLGMKALTRVGMFMVFVAVALFLKYAYDNNYIGPVGRLAIGAARSTTGARRGRACDPCP